MKNSKLAIVIPYYKYSFFEATLQSLADQTDKRFKVYIGDDASVEDPKELLEKYRGKFDYLYHKFDTNLGGFSLVKQWERCFEMVGNEEWVLILGDDDLLALNFVETFYLNIDEVNKHNINVIRYASLKINEFGDKISTVFENPKIENSITFLMRRLNGLTRSSLSEFIFRKEALMKVGFKDLPLAWYSDVLAILEFSYFCNIYSINKSTVSVRSSGVNISNMKDNLLQKNVASFRFYYYLLDKKHDFFNDKEIEILYFKLEKTFLDNKKNIKFWFLLTKLYLIDFQIKRYLNFIFKILNNVNKKYING